MKLTSILKPDASIMAGLATAGTVYAIYSMNVGPISQAHASDANHPSLENSRKKAGYMAFILVSGLFLITRDGNVATLGWGSIVAAELAYRHGIMVEPQTGRMAPPQLKDFTEASDANVVALSTAQADDVA